LLLGKRPKLSRRAACPPSWQAPHAKTAPRKTSRTPRFTEIPFRDVPQILPGNDLRCREAPNLPGGAGRKKYYSEKKNEPFDTPISSFRVDLFGSAPPGLSNRPSEPHFITRACRRALHPDEPKIPLKKLRQLAIDEISIGKHGRFLTVVLDLKRGAVVFVAEGKGSAALEPFWKRLRAARAKIQAVAMDMSPAYIKAVSEHLPKAEIVFDHFHIIKLFNEKLSDLRRELFRQAQDQQLKDVLKGTRWLLLKNPEHLDPRHNEQQRLDQALKLNAPLATAYYLKEDLRQLWQQPNWRAGRKFLTAWCKRALASGIRILQQFAQTLRKHARGILNYFKFPISTGPLEGTNNKIRTLQRQAYGFRDSEFFKLKIYALHETRYELVG